MKKLRIVLIVGMMLSLALAGCGLRHGGNGSSNSSSNSSGKKDSGKKDDKAVVEYIIDKYGFEPEVISSEEEVTVDGAGVIVNKENTGIYDYVLEDNNGKKFEAKYYSNSKVVMDNYLEDYYTEEMSKKVSKALGVEFDDFYFIYSEHNMFGEENYGTVDEVLANRDHTTVYATTYADFNVADLEELNEYKITFEIAKINKEYVGKEKISLDDIFNYSNWLALDYYAKKLYSEKDFDVKTFNRIQLDNDIVYVYFDRVDVTYQIEVTKADANKAFGGIDTPVNVVSPAFNINSGAHGQGVVFFTGKYYAGFEKDKTVVLEEYEKDGNVSSEIEENIVPVANFEAVYYNVTLGNVTFALAEK